MSAILPQRGVCIRMSVCEARQHEHSISTWREQVYGLRCMTTDGRLRRGRSRSRRWCPSKRIRKGQPDELPHPTV